MLRAPLLALLARCPPPPPPLKRGRYVLTSAQSTPPLKGGPGGLTGRYPRPSSRHRPALGLTSKSPTSAHIANTPCDRSVRFFPMRSFRRPNSSISHRNSSESDFLSFTRSIFWRRSITKRKSMRQRIRLSVILGSIPSATIDVYYRGDASNESREVTDRPRPVGRPHCLIPLRRRRRAAVWPQRRRHLWTNV